MNLSFLFGVLAGITALIAYGLYLKQAIRKQSTPNPSSWAIWLLVGIINSITYFYVVSSNVWQSFIAWAVTFSVLVVFLYSLSKNRFSKISKMEITIFILALIVGIFWQITSNDRISNLMLQIIYVLAYIPTVYGLLKESAKEYPASWITAVIAYTFSILSIALAFNGDWIAIIFPLVNGILGNGLVATIIFYKRLHRGHSY